ncbi:aldo-keto reductase family 1 member A1-like [Littorina saxatilis]|uniref:NADP-dependent oxidoreductase domain-containing protein n=1 Tax=Littorina saxatilis TaxID=31220 RepID=A0AAN9GKU7_9CAEN
MAEKVEDTFTLPDGQKIPVLAFGTWQVSGDKIKEVLPLALDTGYRHIDTAYSYGNEEAIGDVLHDYFAQDKLKRADVFVATKLWMTFLAKDDVRQGVEESLRRLRLDYLDLVMIHAPWGFKNRRDGTLFPLDNHGNFELENYDLIDTWKALEQLVTEGKVRSLGVSNFNSVQVDLVNFVAKVPPVVNQVECHAYLPQKELQEFCAKRGVRLSAFAPLGSPGRPEHLITDGEPVLLQESVLQAIGAKYGKTPAQVLLRSLTQRGIITISKSITPSRIKENFEIFDFTLAAEDMMAIGKLRNNHRFFTFHKMAGAHPQYPFNIAF